VTRRKLLSWYDTELGPMPDCPSCFDLLMSPMFIESVYSVSIEHPGDPVDLAKRAVGSYHDNRHREA
jgi:hypothetical protein